MIFKIYNKLSKMMGLNLKSNFAHSANLKDYEFFMDYNYITIYIYNYIYHNITIGKYQE